MADLNGDGTQDLVVFMIDNPPGQNRGVYQVGRSLDANGNVTGGWTGWTDVPNWFSWENQGGGIALADLNGNGTHDLVVFMIDNPPGQNRGVYQVGRSLDQRQCHGRLDRLDRRARVVLLGEPGRRGRGGEPRR